MGLPSPNAPQECPPGPLKETRYRCEPRPALVTPLWPSPSIEMNASKSGEPSRNRCLTPRRSPVPSSPTVPTNQMSRSVWMPAAFIARSTASTATRPRLSSAMPGANSVSSLSRILTSVPSGKTVSRWPETIIVPEPPPRRSPMTFPTSSTHAESTLEAWSSSRNRRPRTSSMKGGAGISVSSRRVAIVQASFSSI